VAAEGNRESFKALKPGTSRCWHDIRNCLRFLKSSQLPRRNYCLVLGRGKKSKVVYKGRLRSFAALRMTRKSHYYILDIPMLERE
jgi:hypothetical protein